MAADLVIALHPNRTLRDGEPEPVLVGHWVEVLRHCLDGLEPSHDDADDELIPTGTSPDTIAAVLRRLLPAADADRDAARAWGVFLLEELNELPSCPADVAADVIDAALRSLREGDGIVTRGTPLDDAIDATISSSWRDLFRSRAASVYAVSDAGTRRRLGFHLAATADPPRLIDTERRAIPKATRHVAELRRGLQSGDASEAVLAAADLTETLYRGLKDFWPSGSPLASARPDALSDDLREQLFETLLLSAEQDRPNAALAGWALMWLTLAKSAAGDGRCLTTGRRARIRALLADSNRDPYLRSDLALLLAVDPPVPALFARRDWIYDWAVVADSGGTTLPPPPATATAESPDVQAVATLLDELTGISALRDRAGIVAQALARLDADSDATYEPLMRRFQDPNLDRDLRDEALVHLLRGGEAHVPDEVRTVLVGYTRARRPEDETFEELRSLVSIVGTGDIEAIEMLLGGGQSIPGYDRAFTRSLGASPDPRAHTLLEELSGHPDEQVRKDARAELALAERS